MRTQNSLLLLLILTIIHTTVSQEVTVDTNEAITHLDEQNFEKLVNSPDSGHWFIMFHTHCPSCQEVLPTWQDLAKGKLGVKLGMVDCTENTNLSTKYNVQDYPTFIYFDQGKIEKYEGENTVAAWNQFIEKKRGLTKPEDVPAEAATASIEEAVQHLTPDNFDSLVNSPDSGAWFIMFYAPWCPHCQRATPVWQEFARSKNQGVRIGMVNCVDHPTLAGKYGVQGFPTFLYFDQGNTENYNGERTVEAWSQFIDLKRNKGVSAEGPIVATPPKVEGDVQYLTQDDFDTFVNSPDSGASFIMFYDPLNPDSKRAMPIFEELTRSKKQGVRIAAVNCIDQPTLQAKYNVQTFPTFIYFNQGKQEVFSGNMTLESWSQFVDQKKNMDALGDTPALASTTIKEEVVEHLTSDNFDSLVNSGSTTPWFIMFYAPWCSHCQAATPAWQELARSRKEEDVRVAMVNCVDYAELCNKYEVRGFPTFIYFDHGSVDIFNGERKVKDWSQFIDAKRQPNVEQAPSQVASVEQPPSEPSREPTTAPVTVGGFERLGLNETQTGVIPENLSQQNNSFRAERSNETRSEDASWNARNKHIPQDENATITQGAKSIAAQEASAIAANAAGRSNETLSRDVNWNTRNKSIPQAPNDTITAIAYEKVPEGLTQSRPGITVENIEGRPNEGRFEDTQSFYKEPFLVIGVLAAILLTSFFAFLCYQQFRGKYTAVDTVDRDIEIGEYAPNNSNTNRSSYDTSMRI